MKLSIVVILVFSSLFGGRLESVSGNFGYTDTDGYKIGTSGIIIKHLPGGLSYIVSYCKVIDRNRVEFFEFDAINQENLPKAKWKPEVGDEVRLGENYDRALIIAPNYHEYIGVYNKLNNLDVVHPDIFAATLNSFGHGKPLKSDFQYFCKEHNIGLVFFVFSSEVVKVDCLTLKSLETTKKAAENTNLVKPFYNRIGEIDSNWFGEGSGEIDSFEYYRDLISM